MPSTAGTYLVGSGSGCQVIDQHTECRARFCRAVAVVSNEASLVEQRIRRPTARSTRFDQRRVQVVVSEPDLCVCVCVCGGCGEVDMSGAKKRQRPVSQ